MQYVCLPCLLRLGQPWRFPARPGQLGRLLPHTTRRAIQTSEVPLDRGSRILYGGPEHNHADSVPTTDSRYSTNWLESAERRRSRKRKPRASISKSLLRKIPHSFRRVELDPEWVAHGRTVEPLEEDTQVVAIDEAFDNETEEEHRETSKGGEVSEISEGQGSQHHGAGSTQQTAIEALWQDVPHPLRNRMGRNQFSFLRSRTQVKKLKAAVDAFKSWKLSLANLTHPQCAEPSLTELRMLHWISSHQDVESMRVVLQSFLPDKTRRERDRLLLYVALRFAPERAPMVIEALTAVAAPPFYMVEDSLQFLAIHMGKLNPDEQQAFAETLAELVVYVSEHTPKQSIRFSQNTIYSILHALPAEKLANWFDRLVDSEQPLHKYILLQFASRFSKVPATKAISLHILRDLCNGDTLNINTPIGASLCTSILAFEENDLLALDDNLATPAELFQCLLDLSLIPNVITYTTIIRDLCLKKELATALDVFEVMKQHGIEPDAYTYSVMINGCKSCGDFNTLVHFAVEARVSNIHDPYIWNDIIHATFLACLKEPRQKGGPRRPRYMVWGPMNAIYTRFFDPEPLRPLIAAQLTEIHDWWGLQGYIPTKLKGAFTQIPPLPPKDVWQPTSATLALMMMGLVRHLPKPYDVIVFYSHFRELLSQGHPTAELLVREQGSLIHDIVLRALLKWKGTLRVMLDIIRDMMRDVDPLVPGTSSSRSVKPKPQPTKMSTDLSDTEATLSDSVASISEAEARSNDPGAVQDDETAQSEAPITDPEAASSDPEPEQAAPAIRHPRPTVHTWSILVKAFMFNHLPGQAEQVTKLMQHHGVKPNLVTWNTLAASYAKMGKTKQAVEAMRRLEAAGFKSDDWTMRAFSYISDKNRAIKMMERTVEQNRLTKMAMDQAQAKDEETRRIQQQKLIEDELRERQHEPERLPRDEPQQHQEESDVLSDDVSREVYEEMVKIVEEDGVVEETEASAWDAALWDEAISKQSQDVRPSEHGEFGRLPGSGA